MFEKTEIDAELHARLKAAGLNPLDPAVRAVNDVVSVHYAEKTAGPAAGARGAQPSDATIECCPDRAEITI